MFMGWKLRESSAEICGLESEPSRDGSSPESPSGWEVPAVVLSGTDWAAAPVYQVAVAEQRSLGLAPHASALGSYRTRSQAKGKWGQCGCVLRTREGTMTSIWHMALLLKIVRP